MRGKLFILTCSIGFICGLVACLIISTTGLSKTTTDGSEEFFSNSAFNLFLETDDAADLLELEETEQYLGRYIQLETALKGKDLSSLLQLLKQSHELAKQHHIFVFQETLLKHIARNSPNSALDKVWDFKYERWPSLVDIVFTEWVSFDLDEALDAAVSLYGSIRKTALLSIVNEVADSAQLRNAASSRGIMQEVSLLLRESEINQLLSEPLHAFDQVFTDHIDDIEQEDLLVSILETWVSRSGIDIFPQFLNLIKDRFELIQKNGTPTSEVLSTLMEVATSFNPEYIWELLLREPANIQHRFALAVLESWSRQDVRRALTAINDLENLELQEQVYESVVGSWAVRDPTSFLSNVELVKTKHRRRMIARATRHYFDLHGINETLRSLDQIEEQAINVALAREFLCSQWAQQNPIPATDWVLSMTSDHENQRRALLHAVLPELARVDADRALSIAQQYSSRDLAHTPISLESNVIEAVAKLEDLDSVKSLLEKVSEPARAVSYLKVGRVLLSWNSIDDALTLGEELPKERQRDYFEQLTISWFQQNPESIPVHLSSLSTDNANIVAQKALRANTRYRLFSEEEIALVDTFVEVE